VRLSLSTDVSHGPFIPLPGDRQISDIGGEVLGGETRIACRRTWPTATLSNKSPSLMTLILKSVSLHQEISSLMQKCTVIVIRLVIVHVTYILDASINTYIIECFI